MYVCVSIMSVHKVRYSSFNLMIKSDAGEYIAYLERAITRERVGQMIKAQTFDQVVMTAKLEALRVSDLQLA